MFAGAQMATGLTIPVRRHGGTALLQAGMAVIATGVFAALVYRYDMPLVLAVAFAVAGLIAMLLRPELATLAAVFLLYSNIPPVLLKLYGVPQIVAGSFILLLGLPLIHFLVFQRREVRMDGVFRWMIVLLCSMLLSSLFAKDAGFATQHVQTYLFEGMLLYWLIINTVRDLPTFRRVVWVALAAGTMLGSMSIYQSFTGDFGNQFGGLAERNLEAELENAAREEPRIRGDRVRNVMRADGPQLGKNRYAQVMLVLVPFAWLQLRNARSRRARVCAVAMGSVILTGGVGLTYSRGAYLAALVMIGVATFVVHWVRPAQLAAGAICGLLALPVVAPLAVQRMTTLAAVTDLDDPSEADGSLRGRATEMLAALNVLLDHPLLGVGPGQYKSFYSVEYHQKVGVKLRDIQTQRRAHMLYFEIGAEGGVIGLAVFMVIPLLLLRGLARARRYWETRHLEYANVAAACFLSIVGFLVTALFLSHAFARFYWFLMALAGTTLLLLSGEAKRLADTESGGRRVERPRWPVRVGPATERVR